MDIRFLDASHATNKLDDQVFFRSINYNIPMLSERDNSKSWRPQFSLRTLLIVVTLLGLYFGSWELTKHWGVGLVAPETRNTDLDTPRPLPFDSSPAPFVVSRERYYGMPHKAGDFREYHFWFFGFTVALPFESEV